VYDLGLLSIYDFEPLSMQCVGKKCLGSWAHSNGLVWVKEIAMTSLLILYNTNLVPLAICAPTLAIDLKQQRLGAYKEL
jgi:hypothetical protein